MNRGEREEKETPLSFSISTLSRSPSPPPKKRNLRRWKSAGLKFVAMGKFCRSTGDAQLCSLDLVFILFFLHYKDISIEGDVFYAFFFKFYFVKAVCLRRDFTLGISLLYICIYISGFVCACSVRVRVHGRRRQPVTYILVCPPVRW